ncbi:uncharacterized protein J4E87_006474 [Alternaria ethzedia]|uniref:uncharacterized protein n=1 Tax=Alternaria ethzedia TaxID=181014 RepID=UPI0020C5AD28|nr:uncharacterized protein J4E87_006474 [Alternaria ethzedia]KAI4622532.1 hypothetical protein J4E87_006474 [Alternaria ethzedia]
MHAANLTLRFFTESQDDTCSFRNSSEALTFTSSSIPTMDHCFNLEDIFGGNTTQGFVNQSAYPPFSATAGINWSVENAALYNAQANYTNVLYHLHVPGAEAAEQYADRRVNIYPAKDCYNADPNSDATMPPLLPWYGYDCVSDRDGNCGTIEYDVRSFYLLPGTRERDQSGRCLLSAKWGAASSIYSSSRVILGAALSASLAIWYAW